MKNFGPACKAFLNVLKNGEPKVVVPEPVIAAPLRSEAITLLAALQREARLVDFLMEPLDGCTDQQIGAAVRDIQKDSRTVLTRMFALKPVRTEQEGTNITVPAAFDASEFKLTGQVSGDAPYTGELMHSGWNASEVNVPEWNGSASTASIVAPVEVEVR